MNNVILRTRYGRFRVPREVVQGMPEEYKQGICDWMGDIFADCPCFRRTTCSNCVYKDTSKKYTFKEFTSFLDNK